MAEQERDDTLQLKTPEGKARKAAMILGGLLAISLGANAVLVLQPPPEPPLGHADVPCPPVVECPPPVVCEVCPECMTPEECPVWPDGGVAPLRPSGTRAPRVDEGAATEGEGHLQHAENAGERDPVQVAAQRRLADGVDRIVASNSPRAARTFITRNLPSFVSMNCAFRDPAAAEHVRLKLREMNALLPQNERLTEEQLVRYERDLRCPRE